MSTKVMLTEELQQSLRIAGNEADAQRRELLKGRRFLFVMGSYQGKIPMYERVRELGASMVILDGPGHWAQHSAPEGLFEAYIEVDLAPMETLPERAFAAVKASGFQFDGVATFEDTAGPLTALMAEALDLPGHTILSVGFSKNKIFTREVCIQAGIPSPRYQRIKSEGDLESAASHVGFPAVLKPISGCASNSTYLIKDRQMLDERYAKIMNEVKGHLKTSNVHSDDESELVWANGFDMTLEEFLDGEEFDVDVLLSESEVVYATVTRDLPQPHLKEVGSQMPPDFPLDKQDEMIALVGQVLNALEFTDGAFHVEVKYTSNGPRLIEVNARIGGASIPRLHPRVWGVDLVEQYLLTRLGVPIRPQKAAQPKTCLLASYMPSPFTGIVENAEFLQPIANHPRVVIAKPKVTAGQHVLGSDKGVPDWLAEIIVFGPTVEAASQTMDEILGQINIPIKPAA